MNLFQIIKEPWRVISSEKFIFINKYIPDKFYLKCCYRSHTNSKLNLENPQTFNEKLQWIKLYDRKDIYTTMVDKYEVKKYISDKIGQKYIIPTLGVWDNFEDIDFDGLPDKFVLKTTHDSGGIVICRDKSKFDFKSASDIIKRSLKRNYYDICREWPYKNVKPRIIAEQYLQNDNDELTDYKFYCFNGFVDAVLVCTDRQKNDTKYHFFDKEWKLKKYFKKDIDLPDDFTLPKPAKLDEMFAVAQKLSEGFSFIRVDLYECNDNIYFGELTFFPSGGFGIKRLPEAELHFGNLIKLKK